MADYINKIRTTEGDKPVNYEALANKPNSLPNPNKIKFTGSVVAEYDGSSEVTVNIPNGASEEQAAQIQTNTNDISELKNKTSELKSDIEQLKQGGTGAENVESRLKGHTMGVIGDSLSDRSRGVTQWFDWIASRAGGMNLSLDCVSGRRLMQFPSDGLSNQCDIICVFGGTNDFNSAQKLGTLDTANTDGKTTFCGAVYTLATELMTNYPKSVIIFITPLSSAPAYNSAENYKWYEYPSMGGHTMRDFADAIKEVCGWLHIPVVDLFTNSGLNYNYDNGLNYFVSDKLHLTSLGQEVISYVIEDEILRHYIPDNSSAGSVVVLTSIDAVFTQGDTIITTEYSLSQLKDMLVVTVYKSDGTTEIIDGYSLSGELTEGISTITVNYLGKTDTFEVEVSKVGITFEPFTTTVIPNTDIGNGVYFIPNGSGELVTSSPDGSITQISAMYSELITIEGATKIETDSNNITYTWLKLYSKNDDMFGANIVFYDKDMNIVGYGVPLDSWQYYNQYPTANQSSSIAFAWVCTDENGVVVTEYNNIPTVPTNAKYMRVLCRNASANTNTLYIS